MSVLVLEPEVRAPAPSRKLEKLESVLYHDKRVFLLFSVLYTSSFPSGPPRVRPILLSSHLLSFSPSSSPSSKSPARISLPLSSLPSSSSFLAVLS